MRFHRCLIRCLSVALLSVQFALAAYACPAALAQAQAPAVMAEMPGCDGNRPAAMDPEQPLLCQAHCQPGSQTPQPAPATDVPSSPVLLAVLDWAQAMRLPEQPADRGSMLPAGAAPPGSPPLYLRLLVLRN